MARETLISEQIRGSTREEKIFLQAATIDGEYGHLFFFFSISFLFLSSTLFGSPPYYRDGKKSIIIWYVFQIFNNIVELLIQYYN